MSANGDARHERNLDVGTILVGTVERITGAWPQMLACAIACFGPLELVRLAFPEPPNGLGVESLVAAMLLGILHDLAITRVVIEHARGGVPTARRALSRAVRAFLGYVAMSFLRSLLIFGGLLLLVVPGIVASVRYSLAAPALVDRDVAGTKALYVSRRLTDGHKWTLFFAFAASVLIGTVPFLGLLVAFEVVRDQLPVTLATAAGLVVDWLANVIAGIAVSVPAAVAYAALSPAETTDALVETFA